MARKGILNANITRPDRTRPADTPKRGAVGALQSSLTKLQENAVQDIDANLIDDAGVEDRLGVDLEAMEQLKTSLQTYGQQVPVLLRPHTTDTGRYEIVYGRRRLRALRELAMPVKAMIRQLDDNDLIMAQGQENTARQDLSFIEKASFASQLEGLSYDRQTIAAALSVDLPMVSRLLKVGNAFPIGLLREIGSAPSIGRDRWMALSKAILPAGAYDRALALTNTPAFVKMTSDQRFETVFSAVTTKPKPKKTQPKARSVKSRAGHHIADIRSNPRGVMMTLPFNADPEFAGWFNSNAEAVLQDLHDQWKNGRKIEEATAGKARD